MESVTSIKDIIYKIAPSGKLIAVLALDDEIGILLDNALNIKKYGLNTGSVIKLSNDNSKPIEEVISKTRYKNLPSNCPSCGEVLSKHLNNKKVDYIECSNVFCCGQSQSHLFLLMSYIFMGKDTYIMKKFLNEYVIGNDKTSIKNMTDFYNIYLPLKGRNTVTRLGKWIDVHGEYIGEKLFNIDIAIENELSKPTLNRYMFWLVANLPSDLEEIKEINPSSFLNGTDEVFKNMSSPNQNYLIDNIDFITLLMKVFNHYSETTWI